jgi:undecaprenyl-diphosphatase
MTYVAGDQTESVSANAPTIAPHGRGVLGEVVKRVVAAYLVLTVVSLAVGLALTHLLDSTVGRWDEHVNEAFVVNREGVWNTLTKFATAALNTLPVIGVIALCCLIFLLKRWFYEAALLALAMTLEITVFLSTTFIVNRPRPAVPRLNSTPSTASFPSGHTAAATVLGVALALIVTLHCSRRLVRVTVWSLAVLISCLVGVGRVYRGLHHPTDVIAGLLLGVGCVVAAVVALQPWKARTT